ncbi:uncharacterized protein FIBRA_06246 [Fibroporia radiculosa]|uniref:Uncharacterized protein n=1 Tax=Fibroporia radiculosa TaxID=599839 RepID=J4HYT6_9APHY|nr:uncharacterized protein FIBRA_06246 [Fibroporia radiculosa]CCM04087.1 predicted protein [Fibroporia radiculosa]
MLHQANQPRMHKQFLRPRQSFGGDYILADNSLVFGPGGQASIVSPADADGGPNVASQDSDQPTPQDKPSSQPQTISDGSTPGAALTTQAVTDEPSIQETPSPIMSSAEAIVTDGSASTLPLTQTSGTLQPPSVMSPIPSASSSDSFVSTSVSTKPSSSSHTTRVSSLSSSTRSSHPTASASHTSSAFGSASAAHSISFYVGVALGAIAVVGLIIALCGWWFRSRKRTRRRALESTTTWPWEKDDISGVGSSHDHLETGPVASSPFDQWSGERFSRPAFDDGAVLADSHAYSLPPLSMHTADIGGAYPTIQLCSANSSVPDLAPDMGTLQVVNLAPGDISSDEASRTGSLLDVTSVSRVTPSNYGTPYPSTPGERPRFQGLNGSRLSVSWGSLQPRRQLTSLQRTEHPNRISEKDWGPLPYPGDNRSEANGWAASIKSNLVSAFNAVVGGSNEAPQGDSLTTAPSRQARTHCELDDVSPTADILNTLHSDHLGFEDVSLEEDAHDDIGAVHVSFPDEPSDLSEWFSGTFMEEDIPSRPAAAIKSRDHESGIVPHPRIGYLSRTSSVLSSASAEERILYPDPPRLPDISSASEASSAARSSRDRSRKTTIKPSRLTSRKKTRTMRRPAMVTRVSSSLCSVGSDMSRLSSVRSERLTDAEQFARRMLKERRKRVMEMGRKRTRISTRRAQPVFADS